MNPDEILDRIWATLKRVPYPGYSRDIVSFGMVKEVSFEQGKAHVVIHYTTEPEPLRQAIRRAVENALGEIEGIKEIQVDLIQKPLTQPSVPTPQPVPGVRHVIAVASGKGGVGKSTVAVNLACALQILGSSVGLLDADIYGPSGTIMLRPEGEPRSEGRRIIPVMANGLKMISIGFFLPSEDQALVWRGPMVMKAVHQLVWDVDWQGLDYLVVDLPPGTGDAQLTLIQEVKLSGAVIVTTPQRVALVDARKGITMFQKLGTPILGIIENMSYFRCPTCETEYDLFDRGGGKAAAKVMNVPFLGEIPIDPRVRSGGDSGEPIVQAHPDSHTARSFIEIARQIHEKLSQEDPSFTIPSHLRPS